MLKPRIDKTLNIVLPLERDDKIEAYVMGLPLQLVTFEQNAELIARTFTRIYTGGLGVMAAPRVAALTLKQISKEMGDPTAAEHLLIEIRRLTMLAFMGEKGWEQIPFNEAVQRKFLSEKEVSEIENALAFFTVASAMHPESELEKVGMGMAAFWGALPTSLNFTAFLDSLPTSTETETSPKKVVSSVPH